MMPMIAVCQKEETCISTRPFLITPMMQAPMITPSTVPEPPASEVPPMTTAAMASSSQPLPVSAWAELKRATRMIPAMAAATAGRV